MIDLRFRELPGSIQLADGSLCEVVTDFRAWIEFERALREDQALSWRIFPDGRPPAQGGWVEGALEFLRSPNATPRDDGKSGPRTVDLVLDGEYIVAGFQQAYGIDLTDPALEMHWHRFRALLAGLPSDTAMSRIIRARSYRGGDKRSAESAMREERERWALPEPVDERTLGLQNDIFAGVAEAAMAEYNATH